MSNYSALYTVNGNDNLSPMLRKATAELKKMAAAYIGMGKKNVSLKIDTGAARAEMKKMAAQYTGMFKGKSARASIDTAAVQAEIKKLAAQYKNAFKAVKASAPSMPAVARQSKERGGGLPSMSQMATGATAYVGIKSALDLAQFTAAKAA